MAKSREQKEQSVEQLASDLNQIKLAVLTDYRGLTVSELDELREKLDEEQIPYRVTKNTLLKLALKNSENLGKIDTESLKGPLAVAFGFDDEVAAARLIHGFAKEHDALEITGALTGEGEYLDAAQVKALALLPTKDQLLGQLVATISAPIQGFNRVLSGNLSGLINVLRATSAK